MRLNHNAMAFTAANNYSTIGKNVSASMARLSSGYKINKSSDDPTGKAISQRMNAQIRGLDRAKANANDGISLIQTAEGALNETHSILARMRELAVQAANQIYDETDLDAIQAEISQLQDELDRISETTQFNGRSLLNGELNRKGYTDTDALSVAEIGGDVPENEYGITVNSLGTQAQMALPEMAAGAIITAAQQGSILINGFAVTISEGMTGAEVNTAIRNAAAKIGIEYKGGQLTTEAYGSEQYIKLGASSPELEALFGITDTTEYGTDSKADFTVGATGRIGFADTATLTTEGNRITVTDKDGFKMVLDATGTGKAEVKVLSAGPMVVQVGGNEGQTFNININKTTAESLGIDEIYMYTHEYATKAIDKLDEAIKSVNQIRSSLGAYENRLDYTTDNLSVQNENLTGAVSRILDTDMAEEITEYTQANVLSQSAMQMLTKANAFPEGLLQLFQR